MSTAAAVARDLRVASIPSMTGIRMSIRTTSGRCRGRRSRLRHRRRCRRPSGRAGCRAAREPGPDDLLVVGDDNPVTSRQPRLDGEAAPSAAPAAACRRPSPPVPACRRSRARRGRPSPARVRCRAPAAPARRPRRAVRPRPPRPVAWRRAFVSASWTIRYAVSSTPAPSGAGRAAEPSAARSWRPRARPRAARRSGRARLGSRVPGRLSRSTPSSRRISVSRARSGRSPGRRSRPSAGRSAV